MSLLAELGLGVPWCLERCGGCCNYGTMVFDGMHMQCGVACVRCFGFGLCLTAMQSEWVCRCVPTDVIRRHVFIVDDTHTISNCSFFGVLQRMLNVACCLAVSWPGHVSPDECRIVTLMLPLHFIFTRLAIYLPIQRSE